MAVSDHRAIPSGSEALPAGLIDLLAEGVALFDAQGRCYAAGAPLARLLGRAPDALVGLSLDELLPDLAPAERARLRAALETGGAGLIWCDGRRGCWLELRAAPLAGGGVLCVRDISTERWTEYTVRLQRVTAALSGALTPEQVARIIIREGLAALEADAGSIFVLSDDRQWFLSLDFHGYPSDLVPRYTRTPVDEPGPLNEALATGALVLTPTPEAMLARWPHLAEAQRRTGDHTTVAVPLLADGAATGVLYVAFRAPRSFDSAEGDVLTTLAQQCAQALERARLYEAERAARAVAERAAQRTARLQEVTATLAEALSPEQVAATVVQQGVAALDARAGSLVVLDADGETLEVLTAVGYPPGLLERWRRFPIHQSTLFADAVRQGELLLLESPAQRDAWYPGSLQTIADDRAWAVMPLLSEGRAFGGIGLSFGQPQRFSEEDVRFMRTLAQQCAQALERARLYVAERAARAVAERAAHRTARLQQVTAALSEALTPALVAEVVVRQGLAAVGAYAGALITHQPGASFFETLISIGYPPSIMNLWQPLPLDAPAPIADAARSGAAVWIPSPEVYAQRYPLLAQMGSQLSAALAALPLIVNGRTIGALGLSFREPRSFPFEEQSYMQALAQQCAQALERARLYDEAQHARAEAEAALGVRDIFFSVAAHELKTPLTSLLGQAQLFQRRALREGSLSERDSRSLDVVIDQALRLGRMVSALLDISRLEHGQLSIERLPLDLGALARRVVDESEPTLDRHHLVFESVGAPLLVDGDALRLEQVVQNLVGNAVKYSPLGGTVLVRVARAGDQVLLSVADQGIGIPADALPKLFTRFYRAANTATMQISGLGIGLYVVREIVALHGGDVLVESAEGQGSTVTVCLPALNAAR
ncbi:MAG TPA: GAF domain-containing protein [Roseiflexaceae bacterium]|nr:GAF domain-containing protein [Roseiflexaceae bacterium]